MFPSIGRSVAVATTLSLAALALCSLTMPSNAQTVFDDEFNGNSLSVSNWTVLAGNVSVVGGLLQSSGGPDHKRIDSVSTFGANEVTAIASIDLDGRYQKFGFRVNPTEFSTTGYYFDSSATGVNNDTILPDTVRAMAYSGPDLILDTLIPVSWGQFHEFSVTRSSSQVSFLIDGLQVASVADSFQGALPVSVWNDRPELMQTDYVRVSVSPVPEPGAFAMLTGSVFLGGGLLIRRRRMLHRAR
jgi:hypothetical protein